MGAVLGRADASRLSGGRYLLDGDLIAWFRWFTALVDDPLTVGASAAEDIANNPVIFQRPQ